MSEGFVFFKIFTSRVDGIVIDAGFGKRLSFNLSLKSLQMICFCFFRLNSKFVCFFVVVMLDLN